MFAYRKSVHVATAICAIVISTASATNLAAQGGGQARRPAAAPASAPAVVPPSVEPARSMLRHLVGRWRVEIRFAGNFDGAPDASGTRVVETLFDDLRLQWTEALDSAQNRSQGVLGFDSRTGRFYSTAVHSTGSGAELLTGTLDLAEPLITFTPAAPSADAGAARQAMESFALRMVDQDHFIWSPLDRGWRAVLTREP
ncbi:MAG TPA: DUF1579 family protein [Gemmatimonadales bacterium]|jgi:hypothetical protein|nr:DUF1579 family protein [Gemmatimonadales bacterium]